MLICTLDQRASEEYENDKNIHLLTGIMDKTEESYTPVLKN